MNIQAKSNRELLAMILGKGTAESLYHGSLTAMFRPLCRNQEVHPKLSAAKEIVCRWLQEDLTANPILSDSKTARDYLGATLKDKRCEVFLTLFLDTRHRLLVAEEMFQGTIDRTSVYPREILRRAIEVHASAVILAHNHPSGVIDASDADKVVTSRIKTALELVDIRLLDHFIIGDGLPVSFADQGLI